MSEEIRRFANSIFGGSGSEWIWMIIILFFIFGFGGFENKKCCH